MRQYKAFAISAILLVGISFSCTKEQVSVADHQPDPTRETTPLTLNVGFDQSDSLEVKTFIKSGGKIWWNTATHYLYVFDSKGYKNTFSGTAASAVSSLDFTGEITTGSTVKYVYYSGATPAKETSSMVSDGVISGTVLGNQSPIHSSSFAATSNFAIMKSGDTGLKNVFGYIKMTLPIGEYSSRIYSVTVSADEFVKGNVKIDYTGSTPVATIVDDANASKSVTIKPRWYGKNNIGYEGGDLYLCIPPGTYHNVSFEITPFEANNQEGTLAGGKIGSEGCTNTLGTPFTIKPKSAVTVVRSKFTKAGTLPYVDPASGPVLGESVLLPSMTSANALCLDSANKILYAGADGKICVYNVSDPMNAVLLGTIDLKGKARQMKLKDGKLYVTARETGAWIFDVSTPASASLIKRFDSIELSTGVDVVDNAMFLATRNQGVEFVDISDPTAPKHIQLFKTDESQSVFYSNGYLYSGEWGKGKVTVIDASDLSNIQTVTTFNLQGYGDGIWVNGDRLYASTGHHHLNSAARTEDGDGHGVEIWNISNPAAPAFISRVEFDVFYKSGVDYWTPVLSGDGKTLFCSDVFNGVYVVDVSNESTPSIIDRLTMESGNASTSIAVGDGVLFVAEYTKGVRAIKCKRASTPLVTRGTLPTNHTARYAYTTSSSSKFKAWLPDQRCAVHAAVPYGDALYVACGDGGIVILKQNSGSPYKFAQATTNFAGDISIRGSRLYAAEGTDGLAVYNIGSDLSLTLESRVTTGISKYASSRIALWVFTPNDKYVIVGSRYRGYQFLAVDNSGATPTYSYKTYYNSYVAYTKYIPTAVCKNDLLPLISAKEFSWFDLSSTSAVTQTVNSTAILSSGGMCPFTDGDLLCAYNKKLNVIQAGTTTILKSTPSDASAYRGYVSWDGANTVLCSSFNNKFISITDITDFNNPSFITKEYVDGKPEVGCFWNGKAVVPCGYQGLLIQK